MDPVFKQLLILMVVVWSMAVMLRRIGLPTIMGELLMGVILGPSVLGWVKPSEIIEILAQLGIFFLMLHAGVDTKPREFFDALKGSLGIALVGAMVPFSVSMAVRSVFRTCPYCRSFRGFDYDGHGCGDNNQNLTGTWTPKHTNCTRSGRFLCP